VFVIDNDLIPADVDEGAMLYVYVFGILKERHGGKAIQNSGNCIPYDSAVCITVHTMTRNK
jgi:hypothetical protein